MVGDELNLLVIGVPMIPVAKMTPKTEAMTATPITTPSIFAFNFFEVIEKASFDKF